MAEWVEPPRLPSVPVDLTPRMPKRTSLFSWPRAAQKALQRSLTKGMRAASRKAGRQATQVIRQVQAVSPLGVQRPPPGPGDWLSGVAAGAGGLRAYRLFRPPERRLGERLPVVVMLHGCGQDPAGFAASTRMNRLALRERCLVLYPEQSRLANPHRCWNWFETESGRAQTEAALILQAVDQVCLLHGGDRDRVAVAGLSAGASMAALLAVRYPERFQAVAMCAGVAPGMARSGAGAFRAMQGRAPREKASGDHPDRDDGTQDEGGRAATPAPGSSRPPLLVIQGREDRVVAPVNGRQAVEQWARALAAKPQPARDIQRGERYPITVSDFRCGRRVVASLVEVDQLGHAWSGGAARQAFSDPRGPDASRMVWRFFAAHGLAD